jgi:hypothetical protein
MPAFSAPFRRRTSLVLMVALSDAELLLTPALQTVPYRGRYEDAIFS